MDTDGGNLRQVTSTDAEEENAVWGLNGIDVVYSVDDRTWEAANVLTGENCSDSTVLSAEIGRAHV